MDWEKLTLENGKPKLVNGKFTLANKNAHTFVTDMGQMQSLYEQLKTDTGQLKTNNGQ